jgi:hypothetical protein
MDTTTTTNPFSIFASYLSGFPATAATALPAVPVALLEPFRRAMTDGVARAGQCLEELARVEALATAQWRAAVDEGARLSREAVASQAQLHAAWRAQTLDMLRRTTEAFTPPVAAVAQAPEGRVGAS